MSSRDRTATQSQPQQRVVVYETSDSPQDGLGSRLETTDTTTTSTPVECIAALAESTDCLVCQFGTETTAATESFYELLSRAAPQLPRVAYVESTEALADAHELGFTAVHLRREADDTAALDERIRAAIETTASRPPSQQLVAASVDREGTVHRAAGYPLEADRVDEQPSLWTLPWAPSKGGIEDALDRATADPGQPATVGSVDDSSLIAVAEAAAGSSEAETIGSRLTVLGAIETASEDGDGVASDTDVDPKMSAEVERYEQILETVPDGVYALDPSGCFTYVNQGLADLTGYSRSELISSHCSIFKSESTVAATETAVSDRIDRVKSDSEETGELSLDIEIETADGQQVPCTDHIALLPFDDQFRGSVGTLRDVSAQQQREETLNGLLTVTRALMAAETTGDVAEFVVEAVSDVLGYDRAIVHLADEDSDRLHPKAASEIVHDEVDTLSTATSGESPVELAFESGTVHRYDPSELCTEYGATAELMSVPLGSYGTLTVGASESNAFGDSDCQLIQLLTANAEEALNRTKRRQTLRRYEMILESVQEMMCVVDSTGAIKLLTDPLARRLDADRSQLVGQQFSTILAESHGDPTDCALVDLFDDSSTGDITFKNSMVVDGDSVPVSVEASQLPPVEGRPEAVVTIHDISDLISAKEAAAVERERFTYLFENLTDPVDEIRVGEEPSIKGVNSAFRSEFGDPVDIGDSLSGTDSVDAPIALDDKRVVESGIQQSLSDEFLSEIERELKLTTTEGTKYFLYRSIPYELDDELCGFEIYTDITALKQREIQLQVLHRLLRHNLRNDLNVIEGFAEMLQSELDDERYQEYATRIRTNATQLAELSETAKTIESVAGHRSLSREPIAIGDLVRSTVESCAKTYEEANIYLENLPETTVSAGPHLETAIGELIENAIEHNDVESPTVSISVSVDDETATVTISDNGPGLPPEEWAVVTGDTEISQLEHGSGLGLWLVRWVTEGYGGELTYHSRDEGSTISIRLPLAQTKSDSPD